MIKSEIFYKGFESKKLEIKEMGWISSRDKFNLEYPPGQKWNGSQKGFEFSCGEFEAICKYKNR